MSVIKYPLATEKSIRQMEAENKLIFVVDTKANKTNIKTDVEKMFGVKVTGVHTLIDHDGRKRAYVKFASDSPAIDVATKLGMM